jgi:predicted phosphodiesterase
VPRIGLISDIHGNLLALDAVLAELQREEVDRLVCLGDVAVGPQPREALARVRELGCPVVMGNWDAFFLGPRPPVPEDEVGIRLYEISAFWADELDDDDLAYMRSFVPQLELPLGDGDSALCFHGSPRSYDDFIFATTPDEELRTMLGDARATVLIGGHAHVQLVRRFEQTLFVNPGSVGLPFSDWWPNRVRIAPWAEYGVLCHEQGRLRVELRRTAFDVEALLRLSLASGMPHARWWAESWSEAPTKL